MIELRSFALSVLVADHLSFRKAAGLAGIRQSAVSRGIRSLEDTIGVSIFERQRSGVRLTRAGAEFVSACRSILHEIDLLVSKAQIAGRGEVGYLRIGINASLSTGELRETLFDYIYRYPGVIVDLIERQRLELIAYVNSRIVDIAIVSGSTERRVTDAMTLWSERLMVALPESHGLASNERISWNDLRAERVLLSKEDHPPEIVEYLRARLGIRGQ